MARLALGAALLAVAAGCGSRQPAPTLGQVDADRFLFERGTEHLQKKNWLTAREYFRRIVDSYPGSQYRTDAKLGIGDSFLGEGEIESLIMAANEFREFLQFAPLNPRADYAQYRLAVALSKQMLRPERDQTATRDTLAEVQKFIDNYPKSKYRPEVDKLYRDARDRLSESEFKIGKTYYDRRYMRGALPRWLDLLKADPAYSKKDEVYFYIGEAFVKAESPVEAVPFFERLLAEFPKSEYADDARDRLKKIKEAKPKTPTR
jgi:outer membrane assembly lipoprotein YfiO